MPFHIVVMAGGSGTRFWPLSRRLRPKQVLPLAGDRPLIAATLARVGRSDAVKWICCAPDLVAVTREALGDEDEVRFLVEPEPRNTTACIALACARILADTGTGDPVVAFLPADHAIDGVERFRDALAVAVEHARATERLVVLGIAPSRPATGFGYIEHGALTGEERGLEIREVARFHEKPDAETARTFLASGRHSWNGGFVIGRTTTFLAAFAAHLPAAGDALVAMRSAFEAGDEDTAAACFRRIDRVAFDYAVLEKSDAVTLVRTDFGWDDLGSFTALAARVPPDARGNRTRLVGGLTALLDDCDGTFVTGSGDHLVAALGVDGLVIVHTPDATLVCPADRVEEVRRLVGEIRKSGREDVL